jgi:tetratricopeptide (TPR) repeat protein
MPPPADAAGYYNQANYYLEKGNCTQAIVNYDKAIALKPDFTEAIDNRQIAVDMKYQKMIKTFTCDLDRRKININERAEKLHKRILLMGENADEQSALAEKIRYILKELGFFDDKEEDSAISKEDFLAKVKPLLDSLIVAETGEDAMKFVAGIWKFISYRWDTVMELKKSWRNSRVECCQKEAELVNELFSKRCDVQQISDNIQQIEKLLKEEESLIKFEEEIQYELDDLHKIYKEVLYMSSKLMGL